MAKKVIQPKAPPLDRKAINVLINKNIQSQSILREGCTQTAREARNSNLITVDLPLRRALEVGIGPSFGTLPAGTEGTLYLEELRVESQISIPADRGHVCFSESSTVKTNTEYAVGTFALSIGDSRTYANSELLAGVNYNQAWSPANDHVMVSKWPVRKISAEQNLKGRYARLNDTYIFGKGCSIKYNKHRSLQRPRSEDSGIGARDCCFPNVAVLHSGPKPKIIKFRIDRDGFLKLDHDFFWVRRYNDTENTLVTDDVCFVQDTYYIRCALTI